MNSRQYYPSRIRPRRRLVEQQPPSPYKDPNNDIRFQLRTFVIFYITLFLLVISITDLMLLLETPIQLPFVGGIVSLIGFYSFAPWFLLGWHVLILFLVRQHYLRLDREHHRHPQVFKQLILDWLEQTVVSDQRRAWVALNICLYWLLPLAVLIGFYYRFADYQDQFISRLHFIIIMLDLILIIRFGIWIKKITIVAVVICAGVIGWYQFSIVEPIHNPNTSSDTLTSYRFNRAWIIPHLNVQRKVLQLTDQSKQLFRFADFTGSEILMTDFSYAHFEFSTLNNTKMVATIFKTANLAGADLREANLAGADLREANLAGANLWEANLEGADLRGVNLKGAYLRGVNLEGADLWGVNLEGADLWGVHLAGAYLEETYLEGVDLKYANLEGAYLEGAHLEGADLGRANLAGADLEEAHLEGADLGRANLAGADLEGAHLAGADLGRANLAGADLEGANLAGVDLLGTNFEGADLGRANLKGADLRQANLQGAYDNPSKLSFADRVGAEDYLRSNSPLFKNKLTQETINAVKDRLQENEVSEKIQTRIIDRLQERVGQAADLTDATFGPLTQDIVDEVDKRVRNSEARKRLGFTPLPRPQPNTVR